MPDESAADAHDFVISRSYPVPVERMFAIWTESRHLRRWWGPKGFKVIGCTMDLRPGGLFHYGLLAPDGSEMWGRWLLQAVEPPQRLAFIVSFSDPEGGISRHPTAPGWPLQIHSTVGFDPVGSGTRVTVRWRPLEATPEEVRIFAEGHGSMQQGWGGTLDQLGDYLADA